VLYDIRIVALSAYSSAQYNTTFKGMALVIALPSSMLCNIVCKCKL